MAGKEIAVKKYVVRLSADEREQLLKFTRSGKRSAQLLTKARILELYLNVAEWGRGVYGAEAAAHHHFAKSASDLTADEAAWLAAILPSPQRYDPIRKTNALTRRHQRILRWMDQVSVSSHKRAQ